MPKDIPTHIRTTSNIDIYEAHLEDTANLATVFHARNTLLIGLQQFGSCLNQDTVDLLVGLLNDKVEKKVLILTMGTIRRSGNIISNNAGLEELITYFNQYFQQIESAKHLDISYEAVSQIFQLIMRVVQSANSLDSAAV